MAGGFRITLPPLELVPGKERFPCWIFPLRVDGPSRIVGGAVMRAGDGMHHGNITTRPLTGDETIRPCPKDEKGSEAVDIARGGVVLFGSSTQFDGPEEWQHFPEGMGYRLPAGQEIVARMHYLNASTKTVTASPTYEWFTIEESSLKQELTPFAWWMTSFELPPRTTTTAAADCMLPDPGQHIVTVLPHMHSLGRALRAHFVGGPLDGTLFLDSPGYDPSSGVMVQYDPPVDLSQGMGLGFSCTWNNTLDKTVVEGTGDNEMCMLFGYSWPRKASYSLIATQSGTCSSVGTPP